MQLEAGFLNKRVDDVGNVYYNNVLAPSNQLSDLVSCPLRFVLFLRSDSVNYFFDLILDAIVGSRKAGEIIERRKFLAIVISAFLSEQDDLWFY